ncbi:MAG: glycosyltransferase family 2 protein [Chitinophagales bacterium]
MNISIIIPCYNNAESLWELINRLKKIEENQVFNAHTIEYVFVDDKSEDDTYTIQQEIKAKYPNQIKIIKLTRNFGSYNSFLAGMIYAQGDCNVYLHADLQDPPELIPSMFEHYLNGYKLVIANRSERADNSIFSNLYHIMVKHFAIKDIPKGGFDLVLFDSKIREEIVAISEKNTNNVYLISWLGYPYVNIPYNREERKYGKSQWKFFAKAKLFVDTFFSFGNIPLWTIRFSFVLLVIYLFVKLLIVMITPGYDLEKLEIPFLSVLISLMLLIIGEYISRVHESVRKRPNFIVEKVIDSE